MKTDSYIRQIIYQSMSAEYPDKEEVIVHYLDGTIEYYSDPAAIAIINDRAAKQQDMLVAGQTLQDPPNWTSPIVSVSKPY